MNNFDKQTLIQLLFLRSVSEFQNYPTADQQVKADELLHFRICCLNFMVADLLLLQSREEWTIINS